MSCPDCYKGFVLPGEPQGSMVGPDYFTPARGDSTQPTKAIILLTDVFGLPMPNPKIVADHFAEQLGMDVWVPDFFEGGSCLHPLLLATNHARPSPPYPPGKPPFDIKDLEPHMPDRAGVKLSWTKIGVIGFKVVVSLPKMIANRPAVVDPRVHAVRSLTRKASDAHQRALIA
jgi:carboxymethylenebutenolidase